MGFEWDGCVCVQCTVHKDRDETFLECRWWSEGGKWDSGLGNAHKTGDFAKMFCVQKLLLFLCGCGFRCVDNLCATDFFDA